MPMRWSGAWAIARSAPFSALRPPNLAYIKGTEMTKKNRQHRPHVDTKLQRTTMRLLRPIAGWPQTPIGAEVSVKRLATDRFGVLGQEVRQVEVQPDGTVGL